MAPQLHRAPSVAASRASRARPGLGASPRAHLLQLRAPRGCAAARGGEPGTPAAASGGGRRTVALSLAGEGRGFQRAGKGQSQAEGPVSIRERCRSGGSALVPRVSLRRHSLGMHQSIPGARRSHLQPRGLCPHPQPALGAWPPSLVATFPAPCMSSTVLELLLCWQSCPSCGVPVAGGSGVAALRRTPPLASPTASRARCGAERGPSRPHAPSLGLDRDKWTMSWQPPLAPSLLQLRFGSGARPARG